MTQPRHMLSLGSGGALVPAALLFLLALAVRLAASRVMPIEQDEFFHLLVGQSWMDGRGDKILDGEYPRGWLYSLAVGLLFDAAGGRDVFLGRLPAILAGALMAPLLFVWLDRAADRTAAWAGTLLLCVAELSIRVSDFARFYTVQALLVLAAAILTYQFMSAPERKALWKPVVALALLLLSFLFQITTVIALGALGLFVFFDCLHRPWARAILADRKWRSWLVLAAVACLLAAIAVLRFAGPLLFESVPWAEQHRYDVAYYHSFFARDYRLLWFLLPAAAVAALARYPRPATFCLILFLFPVLVHSFGGMKAPRYIAYAFPFLLALWGLAIAAVVPGLAAAVDRLMAGVGAILPIRLPQGLRALTVSAIVIVVAVIAAFANRGVLDPVRHVGRSAVEILRNPSAVAETPPDRPWEGQIEALREAVGRPAFLGTADSFRTIYYLGGFDLWLAEPTPQASDPFVPGLARDRRNGRAVSGDPGIVAAAIRCSENGVMLIPDYRWRDPAGVSDPVADVIEARAERSPNAVPGFQIFRWAHPVEDPNCPRFRRMLQVGR